MSSSRGPNNCGTAANFNDGGDTAWSNPTNAQGAQDGSNATSALTRVIGGVNKYSQQLRCKNFGFAIPAVATIVGIEVEVYCSGGVDGSGDGIYDSSVLLLSGVTGLEVGSDKAKVAYLASASWKVYGGATDTWGLSPGTWTPGNINSNFFGVSFKIANGSSTTTETGSVDAARITVYFNLATTLSASETSTISFVRLPSRILSSSGINSTSKLSLPTKILATTSSNAATITRNISKIIFASAISSVAKVITPQKILSSTNETSTTISVFPTKILYVNGIGIADFTRNIIINLLVIVTSIPIIILLALKTLSVSAISSASVALSQAVRMTLLAASGNSSVILLRAPAKVLAVTAISIPSFVRNIVESLKGFYTATISREGYFITKLSREGYYRSYITKSGNSDSKQS